MWCLAERIIENVKDGDPPLLFLTIHQFVFASQGK